MITKNVKMHLLPLNLSLTLLAVAAAPSFAGNQMGKPAKPNILFIAVDDLKPNAGAYGDKLAKTPGMDRLANEGVVFQRSYCQQAICAATRASIMTGMRPDKTRVWDLVTDFRQVNPNVVTMPQYFKSMGYETAAMGKIYHMGSTGPGHDAPSWSVPYRDPKCPQYVLPYEKNATGKGKATECADVPDDTYHDGKMTGMAIQLMDSLSKGDKPFFLAVGYLKPHLPFVSPKKYWDLYDRNKFEIAPFQQKAANSPELAYHVSGELKSYTDIPQFDSYSEKELDHLSVDKQKELLHGYYAAMSYTDSQILQLLKELDRLKIRENTIIVLWGDHGWHLGDHGLWNKHTNFEEATNTLLMMSVPGTKPGIRPVTLCEFTDVYPTLCELAKIPVPKYLDGISMAPAISHPETQLREYSFSQYPRGKEVMGYSIRTNRFRYTVWMNNGYRTNLPYDKKFVMAREMYDYEKDPLEKVSIIDLASYASDQARMEKLFLESMQREYNSCLAYEKLADFKSPVITTEKKANGPGKGNGKKKPLVQ
jgi:arylsulfatase A-like enzyme